MIVTLLHRDNNTKEIKKMKKRLNNLSVSAYVRVSMFVEQNQTLLLFIFGTVLLFESTQEVSLAQIAGVPGGGNGGAGGGRTRS